MLLIQTKQFNSSGSTLVQASELPSEETMRAFEKQIRIALTISLLAMFGSMLAGCASDSIAAPKHDGECFYVNGVLYCP